MPCREMRPIYRRAVAIIRLTCPRAAGGCRADIHADALSRAVIFSRVYTITLICVTTPDGAAYCPRHAERH